MPRAKLSARPFELIFEQAKLAGADNIILNDAEVAIVLAGGGDPVAAGTIANRRWRRQFNAPYQHGVNGRVETRLSDVLVERDRRIRRSA